MIMGMVRDGDDSRMTRMTRMTVMLQEVATSDQSCIMQPRSVWVLFLEIVRIICIQHNQSQGLRNAKGRKIMKKIENSNMFRYKFNKCSKKCSGFEFVQNLSSQKVHAFRQVQNPPRRLADAVMAITKEFTCCFGQQQLP